MTTCIWCGRLIERREIGRDFFTNEPLVRWAGRPDAPQSITCTHPRRNNRYCAPASDAL